MNFTTTPLFIARIWDCYGEQIDYTTHHDLDMLENIVRGDWEGSDYATSFTILDSEGNELLHDEIR